MVAALWDSSDRLGMTLLWLTIVGGLGAAIAVLCTVAGYFVNDRMVTLHNIQTSNTIEAHKAIVDGQAQTITQQNDQISHLSTELQSVTRQAAELAVKAQNAERGISDTYDFQGMRRQNMGGGRLQAAAGEELGVFQTIVKLNNERAWTDLRDVTEAQIGKTPNWLTPFLFSGIAYANLGDLAKAEDRLQFVVAHAGSDPAYADASRILAEVKAAFRNGMKP